MAHKNISERRGWLKERMVLSDKLTVTLRDEAADLFDCSRTTICADWQFLRLERNRSANPFIWGQTTLTPSIKDAVTKRDKGICQYCLKAVGTASVIEHIVPTSWGGVSELKNLVIACRSCNAAKGRGVWVPHNFYEITARDPSWRTFTLHLQRNGKEQNGRRKTK